MRAGVKQESKALDGREQKTFTDDRQFRWHCLPGGIAPSRNGSLLDSSALENLAGDLFRFKELTGDIARGSTVLFVIRVDLAHGFGNVA